MNPPEPSLADSPDYQAFVERMAVHCRCAGSYRPCDGVLAGGICDNMQPDSDELFDEELEEVDFT